MKIALADRVFGVGRAALCALVFVPPVLAADTQPPCATRLGDDRRWSQPAFDDASWSRVRIESTWREQGRQGYDGIVWFRCTLTLADEERIAAQNDALGLRLGAPVYGSYEVYAGGRSIGRSRGWSATLPFAFPTALRIPSEVVTSEGVVKLALRVRRVGFASDLDPESAPVTGGLTLGAYPALAAELRARWADLLIGEVPLVVLAALFAASFLQHLILYLRRRDQTKHLWFGLLAFAFAANTFASTYWIYQLTPDRALAVRVTGATGHLAAAFAIQFLWPFFARRISRPLRVYQLSHVAWAVFVALWPALSAVFATDTARWLWLVPLLVLAAILVLQQIRLGDAEAKFIAAGGLFMILVQTAEVMRNVFALQWPFAFSLAPFGFAAVIVAMNIALALRFRRVHDELDRLRAWLSDEVHARTKELAESRDDALAGLRVKNEFLANISHEIRTPMSGVVGVAELLALTPLTREQKGHVEAIQVSSRSLLALLDDIIDFSRLDENKLTVEHRPFRARDVVDDCLEIMTPLARGKGLALTSSVRASERPVILGDERRTRQVLLNLLSNAIKFTAAGSIDVAMQSRQLENGRVEVRFSVADTGRGIAEEDLERLFIAFEQLEGSSSRQVGGAGLGLAISKRLTELMGGTIHVDTTPERGSIFHFTIVGERADPAVVPDETRPARPASPEQPLRVLLVEDDQVNRVIIVDMLEQLGHRAHSVDSGSDALLALESETFDVILMDVQMPGLDGFEVTRRIRASGGRAHIIALTAHALAGDRERCLAAGMNDYLSKPVRLNDLRQALGRIPG